MREAYFFDTFRLTDTNVLFFAKFRDTFLINYGVIIQDITKF